MPPFKLQPAELAGVVAFIRARFDATASVAVGDAAQGRAVFEGKGTCGACHRVNGHGPRLAPDLSDVGIARTPAALERSVRDPSSAMLPINRPVGLTTKDGKVIRGRRLNEDTFNVQIIDEEERLQSIPKKGLRAFEVETKSPMPSYGDRLTRDEIADLVAYLLTLKRIGQVRSMDWANMRSMTPVSRTDNRDAPLIETAPSSRRSSVFDRRPRLPAHFARCSRRSPRHGRGPLGPTRRSPRIASSGGGRAAELAHLFGRLRQPALQPAETDRRPATRRTSSSNGFCRTRCSARGSPRRSSSNGIMYVTQRPNDVLARRREDRPRVLAVPLRRSPEARVCCGSNNRGVAILGDTLYMGTLDAHLVALDAVAGRPLWNVAVGNPRLGYSITMAPLIVKDKVLVGVGGGEYGIRGSSRRSTRRPARKSGASTRSRDPASPATRPGTATRGRQAADRSG